APPAPVEPAPAATKDPSAPAAKDAGAKIVDAGKNDAHVDAGAGGDGGSKSDAGEVDAGRIDDGGLVAMNDGGGLIAMNDAGDTPGSNGPRDPESMFGLTKVVNAGVQNVVLGLNVALTRQHPVGARMGPILQAIPQWRDFLKGAQTPVDP